MKKLYFLFVLLTYIGSNAQTITPNTAYLGQKLNISIVDCTTDVVSSTTPNTVSNTSVPAGISQTSNINIFNQLNEFFTVESYTKISDCQYNIKCNVPNNVSTGAYSIFIPENITGNTNVTYSNSCTVISNPTKYTLSGTTNFCGTSNSAPSMSYAIYDDATGKKIRTLCAGWNGNFSILLPEGNYTIKPVSHDSNYSISPSEVKVNLPFSGNNVINNFCATALTQKIDLKGCVCSGIIRPGFDTRMSVWVRNVGTVPQSGYVELEFDDSILDIVSNYHGGVVNGNKVRWDFENLSPRRTTRFRLKFNANSPVENPALNIGDLVKYKTTIVTDGNDINLSNNGCTRNIRVVGSYDPNDKLCMDCEEILPEQVGDELTYRIRFENTGNFPADFIRVIDYINPEMFDISTLEIIDTSHDMELSINENVVEFFFKDIQLPFDDDNNDGYIFYKIKSKEGFTVGQKLTNQASIYFDYNAPIITNIAETAIVAEILGTADFDIEANISIYPNPTSDVLNIELTDSTAKSIEIYNMLGQLIFTRSNVSNQETIDVTSFAKGNYIVKINTTNGAVTSKFIKE